MAKRKSRRPGRPRKSRKGGARKSKGKSRKGRPRKRKSKGRPRKSRKGKSKRANMKGRKLKIFKTGSAKNFGSSVTINKKKGSMSKGGSNITIGKGYINLTYKGKEGLRRVYWILKNIEPMKRPKMSFNDDKNQMKISTHTIAFSKPSEYKFAKNSLSRYNKRR